MPEEDDLEKNFKSRIKEDKIDDKDYLISYSKHLERKIRTLKAEMMLVESEKTRLDREVRSIKTELDRMRQPPLVTARIVHHLKDGRIIVKSTTGPEFVVKHTKSIPKEDLMPGTLVYLNQRTFSIVEVCSEVEKIPYSAARAWIGRYYDIEIVEVEEWEEIKPELKGFFSIRLKSLEELKRVAIMYRIPVLFKKNKEYLAIYYDTPLFWYKP